MTEKLKLTKIGLETKGGKKIKLTIDEARELYNQLDELFGVKYTPITPIVIEKPYKPYTPYWGSPITCGVFGSTGHIPYRTTRTYGAPPIKP